MSDTIDPFPVRFHRSARIANTASIGAWGAIALTSWSALAGIWHPLIPEFVKERTLSAIIMDRPADMHPLYLLYVHGVQAGGATFVIFGAVLMILSLVPSGYLWAMSAGREEGKGLFIFFELLASSLHLVSPFFLAYVVLRDVTTSLCAAVPGCFPPAY